VFALERLGFEVWAVPTVVLPHHPGHGPAERIVPDERQFAGLLEALLQGGRAGGVAGIVSGYFAHAPQARAVARIVRAVRRVRQDALYLCDPIIGDAGRLYVDETLAICIREELLPLADAATPNAFECTWLAGAGNTPAADLARLSAALPAPTVLVTSAPALMRGHIGNLLRTPNELLLFEHPAVATQAKGTGDLLAALLLARRLQGHDWPKAAELAIASTFEIVAATAGAGADELLLAPMQHAIAEPRAAIAMRRLGGR
jgi:pyridoxine kinase